MVPVSKNKHGRQGHFFIAGKKQIWHVVNGDEAS